MSSLAGKVAIVTGSGRGIGRAAVLRLAAAGARVIVNDIDAEPAHEVEQAVIAAGGEGAVVLGSVADSDRAEALVQTALDRWGRLDILVNNAGITRDAMVHRMTDQQFTLVMDVIVKGAFQCIRAAAPAMRDAARAERKEGTRIHRKIVNVSSITGLHGAVGNANYATAKAALLGLTRAVAREWAPFLINCNAVAPGFIETRMTAAREGEAVPGMGIPTEVRDRILRQMPFGRIGVPDDVAAAIAFLASPDSDFITGQVIEIHGGVEYINVVG